MKQLHQRSRNYGNHKNVSKKTRAYAGPGPDTLPQRTKSKLRQGPPNPDKPDKQPTPIGKIHRSLDTEARRRFEPGRLTKKQTVTMPGSKNSDRSKTTEEDINMAQRTQMVDNTLPKSELP